MQALVYKIEASIHETEVEHQLRCTFLYSGDSYGYHIPWYLILIYYFCCTDVDARD
jgi:hypothetical protein